jgi:DNA mismatch repair protein MutL
VTAAETAATSIGAGPRILALGAETAAKLAAGEVVERPASAVRELVDNAIDAGARSVSVLVTNGGLDLIRVSDDGGGIERAELPVCVERHTTSKLRGIEDLARLTSLGFRGEALHSIASVSRLRIRSRPPGRPGCDAEYEGLRLVREAACGCSEGTQVEVRGLFYNTPARLKFLKGPTAEANRVEQLVRRYALGHPEVAFHLQIEGKERLRSPGTGALDAALAALYGWRTVEQLLPVRGESHAATVEGFASPPSFSRSNRGDMHVFVNGRWVQSRPLLYALQEAYSTLLMVGRFPLAALHVRTPPEQLDVNVHPAKHDVRFADERGVSSVVGRAVRAALLAAHQTPQGSDGRVEVAQFGFGGVPGRSPDVAAAPAAEWPRQAAEPEEQGLGGDAGEGRLPPLRILGQLGRSYIIAEGPDGMCLVDQHAAHERVLLERLQDAVRSSAVQSQSLLEPAVVPLSPAQAARSAAFVRELSALGFAAEAFGEGAILLRAVPAGTPPDRAATLIAALEEGLEGLDDVEERRRAMLATVACHSAIRAGQVLDPREMRALIGDLERTRVPTACAHGRPTMLEISRLELEREFGRRGSR